MRLRGEPGRGLPWNGRERDSRSAVVDVDIDAFDVERGWIDGSKAFLDQSDAFGVQLSSVIGVQPVLSGRDTVSPCSRHVRLSAGYLSVPQTAALWG